VAGTTLSHAAPALPATRSVNSLVTQSTRQQGETLQVTPNYPGASVGGAHAGGTLSAGERTVQGKCRLACTQVTTAGLPRRPLHCVHHMLMSTSSHMQAYRRTGAQTGADLHSLARHLLSAMKLTSWGRAGLAHVVVPDNSTSSGNHHSNPVPCLKLRWGLIGINACMVSFGFD
jgi:hypothetical protein